MPDEDRVNAAEGGGAAELLTAPYVLEYAYTRSVGPVIGAFLTGLRDRRILAARTEAGELIVPPTAYDRQGRPTRPDLCPVAQEGVVQSWTWVEEPQERHPLSQPFAFALIRLDGADTSMLHCVDAPREQLRRGLRVRARWRDERVGMITDIEAFEVCDE